MPTSVRVGVIVMSVLAGVLLLVAGLTFYSRERMATNLIDAGQDVSVAEAERLVMLWLTPYLVLGILFALAAWGLPRKHSWARWIGIGASTLLFMLMLLSVLTSGGVTALSTLLLVLSVATGTSLMARTTSDWVPRLRARD
ncbi:hypothetical protein GCM10010531_06370 [Blastococcus jejuensis]|uniref:Uncharacterized protein n=1 Tax=Blastococcus jejuensis TaxID=351224 RepID=A0ABP6NTI1_9ACTN